MSILHTRHLNTRLDDEALDQAIATAFAPYRPCIQCFGDTSPPTGERDAQDDGWKEGWQ